MENSNDESNKRDGKEGHITRRGAYKNLLVVSIAFFFNFVAFNAVQNLQSSIHDEPALGFASLCAIYASMMMSCIFLPNLLIEKFSNKTVMLFSIVGFILYSVSNFKSSWYTMIPGSILLGLCAAPLWTCQSSYISQISTDYSVGLGVSKDAMISRFFSIFFMVFQMAQIVGNAISSTILQQAENSTDNSTLTLNSPQTHQVCGAQFCPAKSTGTFESAHQKTVMILMGIYVGFGCLAFLTILIFVDKLRVAQSSENKNVLQLSLSALKQLKDPLSVLLIPISIMCGMEQGFTFGEFTQAYISCRLGIDKVGFAMICYGVSASIMSLLIGILVKWTGTPTLLGFATVGHLGILTWFLHWDVLNSSSNMFYACAGALGLMDAIWLSQTNAVVGIYFPENRDASFSLYRLWQSCGFVIVFAIGNLFCVYLKIYLLMSVIVLGAGLYVVAEVVYRRRMKHIQQITESKAEEMVTVNNNVV